MALKPLGSVDLPPFRASSLRPRRRARPDRTHLRGSHYNAHRRLLYVAIGNPGLVEVIDTATMTRQERMPTETDAHTTAFDLNRQQLAVFLPGTCRAALYQRAESPG